MFSLISYIDIISFSAPRARRMRNICDTQAGLWSIRKIIWIMRHVYIFRNHLHIICGVTTQTACTAQYIIRIDSFVSTYIFNIYVAELWSPPLYAEWECVLTATAHNACAAAEATNSGIPDVRMGPHVNRIELLGEWRAQWSKKICDLWWPGG